MSDEYRDMVRALRLDLEQEADAEMLKRLRGNEHSLGTEAARSLINKARKRKKLAELMAMTGWTEYDIAAIEAGDKKP